MTGPSSHQRVMVLLQPDLIVWWEGTSGASGARDKETALLVSHWLAHLSHHYWQEDRPGFAGAHTTPGKTRKESDPVLLPASDAASKFLWRCSLSVYTRDTTEAGAGEILSHGRILLVKEAFWLLLVVNNQPFLLTLLLMSSCIIPYSSSINQTRCYCLWKSGLKKKVGWMINQAPFFLFLPSFLSFLKPCFYTEHPTALQLSPTQAGKLAKARATGRD